MIAAVSSYLTPDDVVLEDTNENKTNCSCMEGLLIVADDLTQYLCSGPALLPADNGTRGSIDNS